jgi:hypothetical protein
MSATRSIIPEPDQDLSILPRTNSVATNKNGISVVVVPLESIKELDAFGVVIANETSHWLSFKMDDFMLIQGGEARTPLSDTQVKSRLGGGYEPTMPEGINMDIFDWRRSLNSMKSNGLSIVDNEKNISIMGRAKEKLFVFFRTQDSALPMQFIIANIYNEATGQRTRFSFTFNIEKR